MKTCTTFRIALEMLCMFKTKTVAIIRLSTFTTWLKIKCNCHLMPLYGRIYTFVALVSTALSSTRGVMVFVMIIIIRLQCSCRKTANTHLSLEQMSIPFRDMHSRRCGSLFLWTFYGMFFCVALLFKCIWRPHTLFCIFCIQTFQYHLHQISDWITLK